MAGFFRGFSTKKRGGVFWGSLDGGPLPQPGFLSRWSGVVAACCVQHWARLQNFLQIHGGSPARKY